MNIHEINGAAPDWRDVVTMGIPLVAATIIVPLLLDATIRAIFRLLRNANFRSAMFILYVAIFTFCYLAPILALTLSGIPLELRKLALLPPLITTCGLVNRLYSAKRRGRLLRTRNIVTHLIYDIAILTLAFLSSFSNDDTVIAVAAASLIASLYLFVMYGSISGRFKLPPSAKRWIPQRYSSSSV